MFVKNWPACRNLYGCSRVLRRAAFGGTRRQHLNLPSASSFRSGLRAKAPTEGRSMSKKLLLALAACLPLALAGCLGGGGGDLTRQNQTGDNWGSTVIIAERTRTTAEEKLATARRTGSPSDISAASSAVNEAIAALDAVIEADRRRRSAGLPGKPQSVANARDSMNSLRASLARLTSGSGSGGGGSSPSDTGIERADPGDADREQVATWNAAVARHEAALTASRAATSAYNAAPSQARGQAAIAAIETVISLKENLVTLARNWRGSGLPEDLATLQSQLQSWQNSRNEWRTAVADRFGGSGGNNDGGSGSGGTTERGLPRDTGYRERLYTHHSAQLEFSMNVEWCCRAASGEYVDATSNGLLWMAFNEVSGVINTPPESVTDNVRSLRTALHHVGASSFSRRRDFSRAIRASEDEFEDNFRKYLENNGRPSRDGYNGFARKYGVEIREAAIRVTGNERYIQGFIDPFTATFRGADRVWPNKLGRYTYWDYILKSWGNGDYAAISVSGQFHCKNSANFGKHCFNYAPLASFQRQEPLNSRTYNEESNSPYRITAAHSGGYNYDLSPNINATWRGRATGIELTGGQLLRGEIQLTYSRNDNEFEAVISNLTAIGEKTGFPYNGPSGFTYSDLTTEDGQIGEAFSEGFEGQLYGPNGQEAAGTFHRRIRSGYPSGSAGYIIGAWLAKYQD